MPVDGKRVTAILVGTGVFPHNPGLAPIPEVYTNLVRLKQALMREEVLGVPSENIHVLIDRDRSTLLRELRRAAAHAKQDDTLLVYYCGHGVIPDDGLGLLLTVTDTTEELKEHTSLRFTDMRSVVSPSTSALTRILILDCCYAGQAITHVLSDTSSILAAAVGEVTEKRTTIMAAAGEYQPAMRGLHMTVFTQALVESLEHGVPEGDAELTVYDIFIAARDRVAGIAVRGGLPGNAPRPRISSSGGEKEMPFVRNAARAVSRASPPSTPRTVADHARTLQRTLFVSAIDRELNYLKLSERMNSELEKGSFEDLKYHYLGEQGARRWLDLVSSPAYVRTAQPSLQALQRFVCERLNQRKPSPVSLVGLGCGDGQVDRELLQILCEAVNVSQGLAYFPVDLSMPLLQMAAREVADSGDLQQVAILPIVAELQNLGNVVRMWRSSPNVEIYSLLGCTIGNFRNEERVLAPIAEAMRAEDLLLLDARCYGGPTLTEEQAELLMPQFKHKRNVEFALGPLSKFGHRGDSRTAVRVHDRSRPFSVVRGTHAIVTELALDPSWQHTLSPSGVGLKREREVESLALSWSNVYRDTNFVSWLAHTMDLHVVARVPASLAPNEVQTVAFLLARDL
ncbi:L-histidine N(alpha)-methyltransferase [Pendulispora albinea]|uniref:L-histidine N(Alpha)-methyltransferase n=1 Tax=Pendulispora albinea TaxID=2741071 RepID=A0ABZ2LSU4_9BACT